MKKGIKKANVILMSAAVLGCSLMLAGCQKEEAPELVGTYQSQARLKYFTVAEDRDFYISESYAVNLYSDNTYVCSINITEAQQKLANFEYGDVNVINPLAVTTFTRCGTYTLTEDDSVGSFTLDLGEADRLIFATNAGGGHYPVVPTNSVMYVDSADQAAADAFETEWYGNWDDLEALVGAPVTLTGDSSTHMFDAGCMVFEYKSPMFVTLLNREVY